MVRFTGWSRSRIGPGMRALVSGAGASGLNDGSVGIEIVNPGHEFGYRAFPQVQMAAVLKLCRAVIGRHHLPQRNVVAHSDIAPDRKQDPGELFDWRWLASEGRRAVDG